MMSRQELDDDLMIKAGKGDEIAFNQIVQAHSASVHHFLMRYLQNQADADELTSETFWRAWKYASKWQSGGRAKLSTWLFKIANNLAIDRLRKSNRAKFDVELDEQYVDLRPSIEQVSEDQDRLSQVRAMMERLPMLQKQALTLQTIDQMEIAEIMEVLDKSRGSVEQLLVRARKNLREMMKGLE